MIFKESTSANVFFCFFFVVTVVVGWLVCLFLYLYSLLFLLFFSLFSYLCNYVYMTSEYEVKKKIKRNHQPPANLHQQQLAVYNFSTC